VRYLSSSSHERNEAEVLTINHHLIQSSLPSNQTRPTMSKQ